MTNKMFLILTLAAGLTMFSVASSLAESTPGARQLIEHAVEKLNPMVEEGHSYYQEDPERLYANVNNLLETFFDFDAFARGVMGSHYSAATRVQRADFATVLKRSLVRTFTEGLISMGTYSVTVLPLAMSKPQSKRAKVTVQVISGANAKHELTYSLAQDENELWRVRNLVFDGVNIGLTFRSQFTNEALSSAGNIEDVINSWEINIDQ
ncbi:MAG: ABC transporter substrate-binding protein [Gammaproteobacteria bacterium]|nr:ABC transporter substrate-binding protein [Gammaproteobacteria bacterium]